MIECTMHISYCLYFVSCNEFILYVAQCHDTFYECALVSAFVCVCVCVCARMRARMVYVHVCEI